MSTLENPVSPSEFKLDHPRDAWRNFKNKLISFFTSEKRRVKHEILKQTDPEKAEALILAKITLAEYSAGQSKTPLKIFYPDPEAAEPSTLSLKDLLLRKANVIRFELTMAPQSTRPYPTYNYLIAVKQPNHTYLFSLDRVSQTSYRVADMSPELIPTIPNQELPVQVTYNEMWNIFTLGEIPEVEKEPPLIESIQVMFSGTPESTPEVKAQAKNVQTQWGWQT